jgi:rsbT co-antagonist protein RsbR
VRRDFTQRTRPEENATLQAREILETSTPVIQIWDGILMAPLIGTLDSDRTQKLMERLLERIVETNSAVALLDVTGVPTIDTRTAQHLAETTTSVPLLGAQAVLTGVRPAIAQTLAHLGVDLGEITTRSSLAAGLRVALSLLDLQVVSSNGSK